MRNIFYCIEETMSTSVFDICENDSSSFNEKSKISCVRPSTSSLKSKTYTITQNLVQNLS